MNLKNFQNLMSKYFVQACSIIIVLINLFINSKYRESTIINNAVVNSFANNSFFFLIIILIVYIIFDLIYDAINKRKLKKEQDIEHYTEKSKRLKFIICCIFLTATIITGISTIVNIIRSDKIDLPVESDAVYLDITDLGFNSDEYEIQHNYVTIKPSLLCNSYQAYLFVIKGNDSYLIDQYIFELKSDFGTEILAKALIPDNEEYSEFEYNGFDKVYVSESTDIIAIKDSVVYNIQCQFGHPENNIFLLDAILNNQTA